MNNKKRMHGWVYVSIMKEIQQEVSLGRSNSVSWDIYVILFNECASPLTGLTDFESRSETRCVYVRFNVSERWTEELTLFSYGDPAVSPSKHFLTLFLTTCHDVCPEHDYR